MAKFSLSATLVYAMAAASLYAGTCAVLYSAQLLRDAAAVFP